MLGSWAGTKVLLLARHTDKARQRQGFTDPFFGFRIPQCLSFGRHRVRSPSSSAIAR